MGNEIGIWVHKEEIILKRLTPDKQSTKNGYGGNMKLKLTE